MDPICALEDLPDGGGRVVEDRGREFALFRIGEEVFAFNNACPHKGGPLGEGALSVKRREIVCPWHRFRFHLAGGTCVTYDKLAARTYPVVVRDGKVYFKG